MASSQQQPAPNTALYRVQSGVCPDEKCQTRLYFPAYDTSVECTSCGQRHEKSALHEVVSVTNPSVALHSIARNLLLGSVPKKGLETVRVLGLSNYLCKLLSPLLTCYGMDKAGRARRLAELNRPEMFDCSVLGDRAFQISPEHVEIAGYGRDLSGSTRYLKETLEVVQRGSRQQDEVLVPIHADGDGHCLVHAISRALVGRELFWHALRLNLKVHFQTHLDKYRAVFCEFIDSREWTDIVSECDPEFQPGECESLGLRNIHVLGLANVLHRPIILLDSLNGMQSSGDYSGVFLPGLIPPEECRGKDGRLNKPICIAWSSSGRNHYISLVGVKGRPQPRLPHWMMSKAWGFPHQLIEQYIEFDEDRMCTIGGERTLQDKYIQRLATAMEGVFVEKYGVHPSLVTDMHQFVFKRSGFSNIQMDLVTEATQKAVREERLYRCMTCSALLEHNWPAEWFKPGGELYNLAIKCHGVLIGGPKRYTFPAEGIICTYDPLHNVLVPDVSSSRMQQCFWCQGNQLRKVKSDGSVIYMNGDRTQNMAPTTRCSCGYKHYWDGKEYDNMPESIPVEMTWNGKSMSQVVAWFQHETEPSLNSNAYQLASDLVQQHFPGEFGSERLVQSVANQILKFTATKVGTEEYKPLSLSEMPETSDHESTALVTSDSASPSLPQASSPRYTSLQSSSFGEKSTGEKTPSKIILTGYKSKTFHKEELNASKTEKAIKARIEAKAPVEQNIASRLEARKKEKVLQKSLPEKKPSPVPTNSKQLNQKQGQKKIRLTTLDGRQVTLTLEAETTFAELQSKITSELQIPAARQKIRYGFPPRQLECQQGKESEPVPLQNGDRVSVEVISDPITGADATTTTDDITLNPITSSPMNSNPASLYSNSYPTNSVSGKLPEEDSDELDVQVSALTLMASLTGQDIWSYAQNMPLLFERGGIFYKKMKRDVGLTDGTHCLLPSFPAKNFVYVAKEDHVELCLEHLGHFAISPGLEERIQQATLAGPSASSHDSGARHLTAGGSGVVNPGARRLTSAAAGQKAFTGQAHVLSSSHTLSSLGISNMAASKPPTSDFSIGTWNMEEGAAGIGGGMPWDASQPMDTDLTVGSGPVQYGRVKQEGGSSVHSHSKPKKLGPGYTVLENVPTANSASDPDDDTDDDNSL